MVIPMNLLVIIWLSGLIQATVRDEGSLDYWIESNSYLNQNNTEIGNPDIA